MNIDITAQQQGKFRVFKSHMSYESLPKSGRYITVFRNPDDVVCSWYRFFEGWLFETGSISLDEFAMGFYLTQSSRHQAHFQQWYERIGKPDTLVLCYEDIVANPSAVPRVVADFLGIDLDEITLRRVIENTSRDYMYRNRGKFEERLLRRHIDKKLGLPVGGDSSKINKHPTKMKLSEQTLKEMSDRWNSTIASQLGFQNYEQMRTEIPNPLASDSVTITESAIDVSREIA